MGSVHHAAWSAAAPVGAQLHSKALDKSAAADRGMKRRSTGEVVEEEGAGMDSAHTSPSTSYRYHDRGQDPYHVPQPAPYPASQPLTVPSGVANYIVWQQEELDKTMWPVGLPVRLQVEVDGNVETRIVETMLRWSNRYRSQGRLTHGAFKQACSVPAKELMVMGWTVMDYGDYATIEGAVPAHLLLHACTEENIWSWEMRQAQLMAPPPPPDTTNWVGRGAEWDEEDGPFHIPVPQVALPEVAFVVPPPVAGWDVPWIGEPQLLMIGTPGGERPHSRAGGMPGSDGGGPGSGAGGEDDAGLHSSQRRLRRPRSLLTLDPAAGAGAEPSPRLQQQMLQQSDGKGRKKGGEHRHGADDYLAAEVLSGLGGIPGLDPQAAAALASSNPAAAAALAAAAGLGGAGLSGGLNLNAAGLNQAAAAAGQLGAAGLMSGAGGLPGLLNPALAAALLPGQLQQALANQLLTAQLAGLGGLPGLGGLFNPLQASLLSMPGLAGQNLAQLAGLGGLGGLGGLAGLGGLSNLAGLGNVGALAGLAGLGSVAAPSPNGAAAAAAADASAQVQAKGSEGQAKQGEGKEEGAEGQAGATEQIPSSPVARRKLNASNAELPPLSQPAQQNGAAAADASPNEPDAKADEAEQGEPAHKKQCLETAAGEQPAMQTA